MDTLPAAEPPGATPPRSRLWLALTVGAVIIAAVTIVAIVSSDDDSSDGAATSVGTSAQGGESTSVPGASSPSGGAAATSGSSDTSSASGSSPNSIPGGSTASTGPGGPGTSTAATSTTGAPSGPPTVATPGSATTVPSASAGAVALGLAEQFAVLGNTGVDSVGASTIGGRIGASNGSVAGISSADNPAGVIIVDAQSAKQAQGDVDAAAEMIDAQAATPLADTELAGQTIRPGSYSADSITITGTLTLDASGDANAVFVFHAATLTVAEGSRIVLTGTPSDASPGCAVYWRIGTSATVGAGSRFVGTVIADGSVTTGSGAEVLGRLIARNGSVRLDSATIGLPACS